MKVSVVCVKKSHDMKVSVVCLNVPGQKGQTTEIFLSFAETYPAKKVKRHESFCRLSIMQTNNFFWRRTAFGGSRPLFAGPLSLRCSARPVCGPGPATLWFQQMPGWYRGYLHSQTHGWTGGPFQWCTGARTDSPPSLDRFDV